MESVAKMQSKTGFFYKPQRIGVVQSPHRDTAFLANLFWDLESRVRFMIDEETGFGPIGDFTYFCPRMDFWMRGEGWVKPVSDRATIRKSLENSASSSECKEVWVLTTVEGMQELGLGQTLPLREVERSEEGGWVLLKLDDAKMESK
jgi:hypothetical protein